MAEIILREFNLDLDNKEDLLSKLEEISLIHSGGSGGIYSSPTFRIEFGQQPYEVKKITLYVNPKGEIDYLKLKQIIENNLCPSVLICRNSETHRLMQSYFLPEAIGDDPCKRKLILETDIDKRLKCFNG